jgi:SAM-dependent methyltransferase
MAMTPENFARIKHILACPVCKCSLEYGDDAAECGECKGIYPIADGKIYFCEPLIQKDELDVIKGAFKRYFGGLYYRLLKPALAPSWPYNFRRYLLKVVDPKRSVVLDMGSGNHKIHTDIFALDIIDYENVDIVCNMRQMPFRENSVDVIATNSVLEHVADVQQVLDQVELVTRKGGQGIHVIPFLYPFHASPDDFQRLTHIGAREMFNGWSTRDQFSVAGPFSLFNVIVVEVLSIAISLGSKKLQAMIYLALSALMSPIKYLDAPFIGGRSMLSTAPLILTHLDKPDDKNAVGKSE